VHEEHLTATQPSHGYETTINGEEMIHHGLMDNPQPLIITDGNLKMTINGDEAQQLQQLELILLYHLLIRLL
jgi:hypothetical protein